MEIYLKDKKAIVFFLFFGFFGINSITKSLETPSPNKKSVLSQSRQVKKNKI